MKPPGPQPPPLMGRAVNARREVPSHRASPSLVRPPALAALTGAAAPYDMWAFASESALQTSPPLPATSFSPLHVATKSASVAIPASMTASNTFFFFT